MKNQKIFIGNLSFNATEDDVKELLSESGTVVSMRFSKKKGHAVAEMSDSDESEAVIKNLNGKIFMERALRVNFELPSKKAKTESVKRFSEKGKSLSEERGESYSKSRSQGVGAKKSESRPGGRSYDQQKPKTHDGYRSAPKGNRRDDSDDSRGNRRFANEPDSSRDRDSSGGYYSQSFRKRVEKAAHAFSKFSKKGSFSEPADDFMKDEHGRDYRDMEKESDRRRAASRRPGQGVKSRQASDGNSAYGSERPARPPRRDSGDGDRRRTDDRPRDASGSRPGRTSRSGSESRYGESRDGARKTSGRPRSTGERSGSSDRRGNTQGERGSGSSRGVSRNRPSSDRTRNKQR